MNGGFAHHRFITHPPTTPCHSDIVPPLALLYISRPRLRADFSISIFQFPSCCVASSAPHYPTTFALLSDLHSRSHHFPERRRVPQSEQTISEHQPSCMCWPMDEGKSAMQRSPNPTLYIRIENRLPCGLEEEWGSRDVRMGGRAGEEEKLRRHIKRLHTV
jgi:hypothetical protein